MDGVSIGVMYPDGGVSDIQFGRWPRSAGNVAWACETDDCQTGAKNVFGDEAW